MKALILVDLQNDYLSGGVLPVPQADQIIPLANRLQTHFRLIVATQDWHPSNHASFAVNHTNRKAGEQVTIKGRKQILQEVHCVQRSNGAKLAPDLHKTRINRIFTKGAEVEIESYSAFFDDRHVKATGLSPFLKSKKINEVYLLGVATERCIKFTALDARMLDFKTFVIADACRGLNLRSNDVNEAIEEMKSAGVKIIQSRDILQAPLRPRRPKAKLATK